MKKLFLIFTLLILSFLLIGCQKETEIYSVIVPNGGPAVAQMYMQNQPEKYAVDIVNGPDPLLAAFGSKSHDFILAGTNMGAIMYASTQDYIFIASFTYGNLYLVSDSQETFDIESLEGKEIVVFGQNSTPEIILNYVLEQNEINCTFTYVDSVATAVSTWVSDHSKIVLTAEPSLSVLLGANPDLDVIDLQEEYAEISGNSSYPQAGAFAKSTLSNEAINQFLVDLEASVESVNTNPTDAATLGVQLEFGFSYDVILSSIPTSHLVYVGAQDIKAVMEAYFSLLYSVNPALIGGSMPNDNFYYDPSR
ncbi:MAG: hypothetical protein KKE16_01680 [Firmicutes bacterium]|nr:hypothetical protein [Bacillota bacterium]